MLDFKTKHEEKCILPRNNIMFKKFQTKCWGKLNKFCNLNVSYSISMARTHVLHPSFGGLWPLIFRLKDSNIM